MIMMTIMVVVVVVVILAAERLVGWHEPSTVALTFYDRPVE